MNYKIITDEVLLKEFIDWLPELEENEKYYLCLFARSKYCKEITHIATDKSQLKRFLSNKERMFDKIKQLEIPLGRYVQYKKTKDNIQIPQEALALYITPNPRDVWKATFKLQKRLIDLIEGQSKGYNIHAEALSAIQKSKSRSCWVDFDIDTKDIDLVKLTDILPQDSYNILETRGGYHILVNPIKVKTNNIDSKSPDFFSNWYVKIKNTYNVDQTGDNMIPVPGTSQGMFTPRFISL